MSLDLNYLRILNWETKCYVDHPTSGKRVEHPFNLAMGLALMHTGFSRITASNADAFYERVKLVEACIGALYTNGDGTPHYITPEDVHNYIGLASNVSARTDAWFYKHLRDNLSRDLRQTYKLYAKEQDRERVA